MGEGRANSLEEISGQPCPGEVAAARDEHGDKQGDGRSRDHHSRWLVLCDRKGEHGVGRRLGQRDECPAK